MIILISGSSHTGKTVLAQKILEKYKYPYLSIDHLKMGMIRSGNADMKPTDEDSVITEKLWPILAEMIKTAIENGQNLTVEGCYIPFDWENAFEADYLEEIRHVCLMMTEEYIDKHFGDIVKYGSTIEQRGDESDLSAEWLKRTNVENQKACMEHNCESIVIDGQYDVEGAFAALAKSWNIH